MCASLPGGCRCSRTFWGGPPSRQWPQSSSGGLYSGPGRRRRSETFNGHTHDDQHNNCQVGTLHNAGPLVNSHTYAPVTSAATAPATVRPMVTSPAVPKTTTTAVPSATPSPSEPAGECIVTWTAQDGTQSGYDGSCLQAAVNRCPTPRGGRGVRHHRHTVCGQLRISPPGP